MDIIVWIVFTGTAKVSLQFYCIEPPPVNASRAASSTLP